MLLKRTETWEFRYLGRSKNPKTRSGNLQVAVSETYGRRLVRSLIDTLVPTSYRMHCVASLTIIGITPLDQNDGTLAVKSRFDHEPVTVDIQCHIECTPHYVRSGASTTGGRSRAGKRRGPTFRSPPISDQDDRD